MELRIAKLLGGHRVPMSGAGSIKGDCVVNTDKCGQIYIECKYSAGKDQRGNPRIRLDFRWLDKMAQDARYMRSKFAVLIFRFHDTRLSDYVIMPLEVFTTYDNIDRLDGTAVFDMSGKNGWTIIKPDLDRLFEANSRRENIFILRCGMGNFVVTTLDIFKEIIHDTNGQ
jgi:hypothetical protein